MRAAGGRLLLRSTGHFARRRHGWLQAGLTSFAYRLAHLCAPRAVLATTLAVAFYIL
jgi:hypothetical protein